MKGKTKKLIKIVEKFNATKDLKPTNSGMRRQLVKDKRAGEDAFAELKRRASGGQDPKAVRFINSL